MYYEVKDWMGLGWQVGPKSQVDVYLVWEGLNMNMGEGIPRMTSPNPCFLACVHQQISTVSTIWVYYFIMLCIYISNLFILKLFMYIIHAQRSFQTKNLAVQKTHVAKIYQSYKFNVESNR